MLVFFDRQQRPLKIGATLIVCFSLCWHYSSAQHSQALPDSINVDDSLNFTEGKTDKSNHIIVDTMVIRYNANPEDSLILRNVPDSVNDAFQKNEDFAYANDPEYWITRPVVYKKGFFEYLIKWLETPFFRGLVIALLVGIILFALYRIITENNLHMFYSSAKDDGKVLTDESDLRLENMENKIKEAINANDFRTAIRFMYLKSLKLASDRGLIRFHAQGTNQEYIGQMAAHEQATLFRFLTTVYEHTWYGGFDVKPDQFDSLRKDFEIFYNTVSS